MVAEGCVMLDGMADLELPPDQMRALGHRVMDLIVAHLEHATSEPAAVVGDWDQLHRSLLETVPRGPQEFTTVLERVLADVLPSRAHLDHPRFFSFVPGPSNFVSILADTLATGHNVFAGSWMGGSGAAVLELATIGWMREWFDLPETAGGLFVSGGSMANLTALAAARDVQLARDERSNAVVYFSDQTHSSVARGLKLLGFFEDQIQVMPSDAEFRLSAADLRHAIEEDRGAGRKPFCVVVNAGTTNTGAVDPLQDVGDICQREGLWMHADGAYGAAAILCDQGKALLAGLERAHSIAMDPHKWLFQPIDCGCVLVRDREWLRQTFDTEPEYLRDARAPHDEGTFWKFGPELTRPFRALKLWMSLQVFGLDAFRNAVQRGFELAEFAEQCLRDDGRWQIVTPAQMGTVTFRHPLDNLNRELTKKAVADGFALVISTVLRGQTVLRMCTINPRTTLDDIRSTVQRLGELASP